MHFANKGSSVGKIYKAKVHHSNVIAYFNDRKEKEVLIDAKDLTDEECIEG